MHSSIKAGCRPRDSRASSPTNADVWNRVDELAQRDSERIRVEVAGYSGQGRRIDAVTLTDPAVSDELKQHVLIVAGQHGNEESGRLIALELMDQLLADAHRQTLRQQKIVVMPNVNPDGAEEDCYATPGGVKPNLDHGPDGPTIPESKAVEDVANSLWPDVFVDMHARGHAGCSYDMVLYPDTRPYTEDDNLFHQIAADMAAAGEQAGLPHITHPLTWWTKPPLDACTTTAYAYRNFKSIVMLTESAEANSHSYAPALTARVGVARIMALLAWGNRRHPKLYYPGYPNMLVLGMFSVALLAVGRTAAERRRSRIEIWRQRAAFQSLRPLLPEPPDRKTLLVDYDGPPLRHGVGLMLRAAGHRDIAQVRCRGKTLQPAEIDGYLTYRDEVSTYIVATVPYMDAGTWEVEVDLK